MAGSAKETRRTVKSWYPDLLKQLPIDELTERFENLHLLSSEQRSKFDGLASPEEKVGWFLNELLTPGLMVDYTGHFDEMVKMMKESDDTSMKLLADKMTQEISIGLAKDLESHEMTIDFNAYDDPGHAFTALFMKFQDAIGTASSEEFKTIKNSCVAQASEPLRGLLKCATDQDDFFGILADNNYQCNWMDVSYLKVIANACGNIHLQSLVENYTDVINSKSLREVWSIDSIPEYYAARIKYYSELKAAFDDKDPDDITVGELMKFKPQLAVELALDIYIIGRL